MEVTYERISGSLGSLLLTWARIEQTARQEVARTLGDIPKSARSIAGLLRTWKSTVRYEQSGSLNKPLSTLLYDQLKQPLEIRNGLCHGLIGVTAQLPDTPASLKWELNGEAHSIEWIDLQAMLGWLSRVPQMISLISSSGPDQVSSRLTDNLENRCWWLSEFALELPIHTSLNG